MRRIRFRHAFVLAGIAAAAVVAAPALSTSPYLPAAVDFEQSLEPLPSVGAATAKRSGGDSHLGEGPVGYRSGPIEAPKRFDLVGIAGERRPVELRTRTAGGEWSDWVETANGDPVYAGGADELQLRARGWRPDGTLHYVNVSGTADPATSALTAARTAINGAFVTAASALAGEAVAAPPRPDVISRADWGANRSNGGCKPRSSPAEGEVKAAVVHHTVTTNSYSRSEAKRIVLGICRFHRNGNGWNDIGYNALVDRFGRIFEGRDGGLGQPIVGAHAQGFNSQTTGVASIGDHSSRAASKKTKRGLVHFLSWKLPHHGVNNVESKTTLVSGGGSASRYPRGKEVRKYRIMGHRAVGETACPGGRLNSYIDKLRKRTQNRIDRFP
jgi:hypothetical protein